MHVDLIVKQTFGTRSNREIVGGSLVAKSVLSDKWQLICRLPPGTVSREGVSKMYSVRDRSRQNRHL